MMGDKVRVFVKEMVEEGMSDGSENEEVGKLKSLLIKLKMRKVLNFNGFDYFSDALKLIS